MSTSQNPPDGLSGAKLIAWKRKQKILNRGEAGIERITITRDSVASASKQEFEQKTIDAGDSLPGTENSAPADENYLNEVSKKVFDEETNESEPELASWEKKWKLAAEKAPVIDVEFAAQRKFTDSTETVKDSSGIAKDGYVKPGNTDGIRHRKAETTNNESVRSTTSVDTDEDAESMSSMKALREKLRVQKWYRRETFIRTLFFVLLAFVGGIVFANQGGLVSPSAIAGYEGLANSDKPDIIVEDLGDGKFELNMDLLDIDGKDLKEKNDNNGRAGVRLNTLTPPIGGWLSIPILTLILHVMVHFTLSFIGGYQFSLLESVDSKGTSGDALSFPYSILASFAANIPVIKALMQYSKLMSLLAGEMLLFIVVFIVTASANKLFLDLELNFV